MPKFVPTYSATTGLTAHTTIGTEEELNYIVKPQSTVPLGYDYTLYVSAGSVSLSHYQVGTVGGAHARGAAANKSFRKLVLAIDQVHHYGQNSGKLELKTGPHSHADAVGVAAKARTTFVSCIKNSATLKALVDKYNTTSFVASNPEYKLIIVSGECNITATQANTLAIGPKDSSATSPGATTQVNISVPFVDIGKDDDTNLLLQGSWRSPARQASFKLAIKAANKFVDVSTMGNGNRELRKVRSLLTLFFYNFLVYVRAVDASTLKASTAISTINKDNWDWLPKISLADALTHITGASNPAQPAAPLAAKETDTQAMNRIAGNAGLFDPAFAEVTKLIRASLVRKDTLKKDKLGNIMKDKAGKPVVLSNGKDLVMTFFTTRMKNDLKKLLESFSGALPVIHPAAGS